MRIHREGYQSITISAIIFGVINFCSFNLFSYNYPILSWGIFLLTIGLFIFIISFFRIPNRKQTFGESLVTSPCDGKVVVIEEVIDEEYFNEKRLQVSIFMSPLNVHVNVNPISGLVKYSQYHKGKYLVAWHPKSSTENERHSVVISNEKADILVKQIAGAVAKRIVNYLTPGMQVEQNHELGFIKFGSRVDLLLPVGTKVNVKLNEAVQGGVSVIATLD